MKIIVKKEIKGKIYYYLQYKKYSKSLGSFIPKDLPLKIESFLLNVAKKEYGQLSQSTKHAFRYGNLEKIEIYHHWYAYFSQQSFRASQEMKEFHMWFAILFCFNSNRSEGSKTSQAQVEAFAFSKKKKPKTKTDREILNSFQALNFALSKNMKWNLKHIKKIHTLLLDGLDDSLIIGKWKNENNVAPGNQPTVSVQNVPQEMKKLLTWLQKEMKKKGLSTTFSSTVLPPIRKNPSFLRRQWSSWANFAQ